MPDTQGCVAVEERVVASTTQRCVKSSFPGAARARQRGASPGSSFRIVVIVRLLRSVRRMLRCARSAKKHVASPSVGGPLRPFPAIVRIVPFRSIARIRLFEESEK